MTEQTYIGTKRVVAWPQTDPKDVIDGREGYAVRYDDGYVSWSPKGVFEAAYHPVTTMPFEGALWCLKRGMKVCRAGWNGKGMFLFLVPGSTFKVNRPPLLGIYPEGTEIQYHAHIDMKTAQGYVVPRLASQADLLADDWTVVE